MPSTHFKKPKKQQQQQQKTNLNFNTFDFLYVTAEEVNKIIKDIIDLHFTNIINKDIDNNRFSENAKIASVRPIFKKKERETLNYRPVSILNCFSKIYERYILEKFKSFMNGFLSQFMSAYRENYRKLMLCFDKECLDKGFVTSVLMVDLSKAFDSIPYDLFVAKLHAYGISLNAETFIYSYHKRRV